MLGEHVTRLTIVLKLLILSLIHWRFLDNITSDLFSVNPPVPTVKLKTIFTRSKSQLTSFWPFLSVPDLSFYLSLRLLVSPPHSRFRLISFSPASNSISLSHASPSSLSFFFSPSLCLFLCLYVCLSVCLPLSVPLFASR